MGYAYSCTEDGHTSGNIWTFLINVDDTNIGISDCYYVKAVNTSSVPNSEAVWCFYNGITPGVSQVSAGITRYAYNNRQEFPQNVTVESYAQSDVSYVRPPFVSTSLESYPAINEVVTGTSVELNNVLLHQGLAQNARTYFDTPATPYMDCDIFTSGADGNKLITLEWDNIQNIPAGMYPASYYLRIHADDDGQGGRNIAICPYVDKEYQVTYQNVLSQMFESEQATAILNGWLYLNVYLAHNDDGAPVIDQSLHFKVFRDGSITDETDPGEAGNRDTHPNTSPRHNGEYADGTGSLTGDDAGQALSVDNILTTSYAVSETDLGLFGDWLWANDLQQTLFGNQVSPMENILSCKRIPFDVDTGTNTTIWLGNINSGVAAHFAGTKTHKQPIGSGISIPMPCGGTFLDEQNNVSIYLPYCGIHSIPTSICYDKTLETITLPNTNTFDVPKLTPRTLTVEYVFDMIYGSCAALLYMDGSLFGVYNGSCGVDIPLTQSNRASNQLALNKDGGNMVAGIVTSTVGGMISGAMAGGLIGAGIGGLIGAGESALGGALRTKNNAVNQETHFTTSGGFSSQIASFMPSSVMVFVEYTDEGAGEQAFTDFEKVYAHENGFPCNLNLNMGDIVGYTELAGSIEIDSIPCLEEERVLLKQALQEGFYL